MNAEPREPAVAESYPTFWDATPPAPAVQIDPSEDAYTSFINMTDEELPVNSAPDTE